MEGGVLGGQYGVLGKEFATEGAQYGEQGREYGVYGAQYGVLGKEYANQGADAYHQASVTDKEVWKEAGRVGRTEAWEYASEAEQEQRKQAGREAFPIMSRTEQLSIGEAGEVLGQIWNSSLKTLSESAKMKAGLLIIVKEQRWQLFVIVHQGNLP